MNMSSVFKALRIVFSKTRYRALFIIILFFIITINILMLIGLQWILGGATQINVGFFSKPPNSNVNETVIMWVESNYRSPTLFWAVYLTPELFITILLSSIIISLLFSEILYLSREMQGKFKVRKKSLATSATSIATVIGITSITSTTLSCPACGATISATLIAILVSTISGSTLGISSIFTQIAFYAFWIGIILNLIMLYITSNNLLKIAPIFYIDKK
ncbi:MAG: hypothetical protein ACP5GU_08910 [Thermoprotei archaeon]